jgi:hypothetical protein
VTVQLRPLDAAGRRAYLDELRPRFLALRVEAGRVRFAWALPSWALEEPLRFLLRLVPIAYALAPGRARAWLDRADAAGRLGLETDAWRAADELFSERDRDLLALPADLPLVDIATSDARIVITQVRP